MQKLLACKVEHDTWLSFHHCQLELWVVLCDILSISSPWVGPIHLTCPYYLCLSYQLVLCTDHRNDSELPFVSLT